MKVITSFLFCSSFIAPYISHHTYSTAQLPKPYPSSTINNAKAVLAQFKQNSIQIPTPHSHFIIQAIQYLGHVPGFRKTLAKYLNQPNPHFAKGTQFEIETALKFKKSIIAMNFYLYHQNICRQFDVIIHDENNNCTIFGECKNINWEKMHQYKEKLEQQFFEQKQLVEKFNAIDKSKNNYQIFSKAPLDSTWKAWFDKHAIKYYEA